MSSNRKHDLAIDKIIKFINTQPALIKLKFEEKDKLAEFLFDALNQLQNKKIDNKDIQSQFVKLLTNTLNIASRLNDPTLKLTNEKNLMDQLNEILKKFNLLDKNGKLDKAKLKELTNNPTQLNQLKLTLTIFCKRLLLELKLVPENKKDKAEELANKMANRLTSTDNKQDPNENLLGLLNAYITGSLAAVVQCFLGNYTLVDQNPEHGAAQIDQLDKAFSGEAPAIAGTPLLAQELVEGEAAYSSPFKMNPFKTTNTPE